MSLIATVLRKLEAKANNLFPLGHLNNLFPLGNKLFILK